MQNIISEKQKLQLKLVDGFIFKNVWLIIFNVENELLNIIN